MKGTTMITIVMACSPESQTSLLKKGFTMCHVLVKQSSVQSTEENKRKLEREMFGMPDGERPYQFLVSDYWGMGPD